MNATSTGERQRCQSPGCDQVFRKRTESHIYCSNRCKCHHFRWKEKLLKATVHSFFEAIKNNQDCLEHLYRNPVFRTRGISREVLEGEGVILVCCSDIGKNQKSGRKILWSCCYGVEPMDEEGVYYTLHQRTADKIPQFKIKKTYA